MRDWHQRGWSRVRTWSSWRRCTLRCLRVCSCTRVWGVGQASSLRQFAGACTGAGTDGSGPGTVVLEACAKGTTSMPVWPQTPKPV